MTDPVNHPEHYAGHPSGVECIRITEHMNFCLGNAVKYIWRAGLKSPDAIQDLEKAAFYLAREIRRLKDAMKEPAKHEHRGLSQGRNAPEGTQSKLPGKEAS